MHAKRENCRKIGKEKTKKKLHNISKKYFNLFVLFFK